jgi:hypothetical protein
MGVTAAEETGQQRTCKTRQHRVCVGVFDKIADVEENSGNGGDVVVVHAPECYKKQIEKSVTDSLTTGAPHHV